MRDENFGFDVDQCCSSGRAGIEPSPFEEEVRDAFERTSLLFAANAFSRVTFHVDLLGWTTS